MQSIQNSHSNSSISLNGPMEKKLDPVVHLLREVCINIFSYLSAPQLGICCLVSKQWRALASSEAIWDAIDLRKLSPLLRVFDESDWKDYVDLDSLELTVDDALIIDKRASIPILKKYISLPVEGNAGLMILTMPKGLSFNKLEKLLASPKLGNGTNFTHVWQPFLEQFGNVQVDSTYKIVITNNFLNESRNLSLQDQENLVEKMQCELPRALEIVTFLAVKYLSLQQYRDQSKQWTFARCIEQVNDSQIIVGDLSMSGQGSPNFMIDFYGPSDEYSYGVVAVLSRSLLKFKPQTTKKWG